MKAKFDKIGPLIAREEKSLEVFEVSPNSSTIAFMGYDGYILLVVGGSFYVSCTLDTHFDVIGQHLV